MAELNVVLGHMRFNRYISGLEKIGVEPTEPVCSSGRRNRGGADRSCLHPYVGWPTHPFVRLGGGGEPILARECRVSSQLIGRSNSPANKHIKFESLWTSYLLYYKYTQTNEQTYLKDGSPYRYETCLSPNSSLSWSKPNICPIFTTPSFPIWTIFLTYFPNLKPC